MYNNTIIIRVHVSRGNLRTSWAPSRRFTPYRTRPGPILGLGPLLPRLPSSSPYVHALKPYVVVVVITISYISYPYRAASFLSIILFYFGDMGLTPPLALWLACDAFIAGFAIAFCVLRTRKDHYSAMNAWPEFQCKVCIFRYISVLQHFSVVLLVLNVSMHIWTIIYSTFLLTVTTLSHSFKILVFF